MGNNEIGIFAAFFSDDEMDSDGKITTRKLCKLCTEKIKSNKFHVFNVKYFNWGPNRFDAEMCFCGISCILPMLMDKIRCREVQINTIFDVELT